MENSKNSDNVIEEKDENEVFIPSNNNTNSKSEINSIFANSNDEEEIAVVQKEFVPEYQRVYDDEVYFQELENYFLSKLSLYDQNSIFKQKRIVQTVENLLSFKNKVLKNIEKPLDVNPFIFKFSQNEFSSPYIIPIVLDKKKEYVNMDNDEILAAGELEYKVLTDVDTNYDELLELKKRYKYGEIDLKTYYRLTIDLSLPFLVKETLNGKKIGYQTTLSKASNLLRYDNIKTRNWKIRRSETKITTNYLHYEENKAIPSVVEDVIFEGEDVNIVGFLLLPFGKDKITENLTGKSLIAKSGILGNLTDISKGENAIITIPNHNLSNGDSVYIKNSNSFPSIDGLHEDIIIVDENRFMIRVDTLHGKGGDTGVVYCSLPLDMTEIDVPKSYPIEKAMFYKFNSEILTEDDYKKILDKALPSVFEIYKRLPLNKIYSMNDVKTLLEPYDIKIDDLYVDYYKPIDDIFKKRTKQLQKEKIDINDFFLKNYQVYLDKKGVDIKQREEIIDKSVYRDDFLKNPIISKYYGVYSPLNLAEDNVLARYLWVNRQVDHGNLFYSFVKVQLTKTSGMNKQQLDEIETELDLLNKKNSNIIKKIENEDKKNKSTGLCDNKKGLIIFKTMGELSASQKIDAYKDGDFALVELDEIPSKQPIYVWSGQFNQWQPNKFISNYSEYCNFGTLKINDFDFRKVLCMSYENQCKLVQQVRLERTKQEIEKLKKEYEEVGKYYERKSNLALLEKELEAAILKIQIIQNKYTVLYEDENKYSENTNNETFTKTPIQELIGYIDNLPSNEDAMELKFKLLVKDGLLIDETIFSKTFRTKLMCGHYQYLYDISRNINTPRENIIQEKLLSVYGDAGKINPGFITCRHCGEILMRDEYDENEGISKVTGEIRKSRDILQSEKQKYASRKERLHIITKELDYYRFDCNSNEFRNELIHKGLNIGQIPIAVELCNVLNSLIQKMNILLRKNDFLSVVINVIQKLGSIPNYQRWRKDKLDKLKARNPTIDFSRINESVLEDEYKVQVKKKKVIFTAALLLIILQTATPQYDIRATIVAFSGLNGEEGITFMAQILEKTGMAVIKTPLQKNKKMQKVIEEDELVEEITKAINVFKTMPEIRKRYSDKLKYIEEENLGKKISTEVGIVSGKYPEIDKLPENLYQIMNKQKNKDGELYSTATYIFDRLNYLAQESIEDIYRYVEGNDKLYPTEIASSCCIQPLSETTNYDTPIIEITEGRFENNLIEINRGYEYLYDIRRGLSAPWFRNKPVYTFYCGDLVALTFFRNTNLEHKRFGYYQMNGEREKFDQEGRSLFSGKKKETLLKENHTEEEYRELVHNIMKKSYKKIKEFVSYEHLKIKEMITRADDYLDSDISTFVKKMDNYLNQKENNEYISNRIMFLKNLGILTKKEKDDVEYLEKSDIEPIQKYISRNQFAYERARRIINIINFKFRRNMTRIANEYKRVEKPIEDVSMEVQKNLNTYIDNQNDLLSNFMTKLNAAIFKLIKWEYTPQEIESILGRPPRINYDMTVIEDSDYVSMEGATTILIYVLVNQLNEVLDINFEDANLFNLDKSQIPQQLNMYGKTTVAQFIETLFKEIENEAKLFDFTKNQFIQYKRAIYNDHFEKEAVKFNEMTEGQKMLYKLGFDYKYVSAKEMEDIAKLDNSVIYEVQEKEDLYVMRAKEMYMNKYGEEPTDSQLEDMKDKLKKKEMYDRQEDDDFGETGVSGGDYGDLDENVFGEEDAPIIDENAFIEQEVEM